MVLVNVLAGALLVGLAEPIVRLLFEGGNFHPGATRSVASALVYLAPGLVAFSGTSILARAFYAVGDTRVPMQISLFCLGTNVVLSVLFALAMREAGLALANTLTSTVNLLLLGYALKKKFPKLDFGPLTKDGGRLVGAAVGAGLVAWGSSKGWREWQGESGLGVRLMAVFGPALMAGGAYFGFLWWARVNACRAFLGTVFEKVRKAGRTGGR